MINGHCRILISHEHDIPPTLLIFDSFFFLIGSTYVFWASFLHCHQNQRSNRSFPSSCLFITLAAVVFLFRIKRVKNKGIRRTNNKNEGLKSVSFVSYFNGSGSSSLFWLLLPFPIIWHNIIKKLFDGQRNRICSLFLFLQDPFLNLF